MKLKKLLLVMLLGITLCACDGKEEEVELPLPEVSEGMRGELGIDKNVNETTLDKYLEEYMGPNPLNDTVVMDMYNTEFTFENGKCTSIFFPSV